MVKINYAELRFEHIVVFTQENTIFACCRENGVGKMRLFLAVGNGEGCVYTRNGRIGSWEVLGEGDAENIRQQIKQATKEGIAVYQLRGSYEAIMGQGISAN